MSAPGLVEAASILEQIGAERRVDAMEAGWRNLSTEATEVLDVLRQVKRRVPA